jgi:hypothetical protein
MHLFYVSSQNSSGVEQLTRNEQVKGSIPFFGSDGSFGNRFFYTRRQKTRAEARVPIQEKFAYFAFFTAMDAWAAARRAMGTRNGEQET